MSEEHQIVLDELLSSVANIDEAVGDNFLNEMSSIVEGDDIENFFRDLESQDTFNTTNDMEPIFSPLIEIPDGEITAEQVFSSRSILKENSYINNPRNSYGNAWELPSGLSKSQRITKRSMEIEQPTQGSSSSMLEKKLKENIEPQFKRVWAFKKSENDFCGGSSVPKVILSRLPVTPQASGLVTQQENNQLGMINEKKVLVNKSFIANNNGFFFCQCNEGIKEISFVNFKCSNVVKLSNKNPQETLSVTLKASEISVNTFARMVRCFSELKYIKFENSKISTDPCWDRKIALKNIESITMINSAIPLNMFETKNIKKFVFMDMLSHISPIVMTLIACKLVEQKNLSNLLVDISPKIDILEYLGDIYPKLSGLNKLMVRVAGDWNIKPYAEMINNNQASLKYVGVTVLEENIPTLEFDDVISSVMSGQNIQVVSLCLKYYRNFHKFEYPRESCKVSALILQANDEKILGLALRRIFICKLTLEIKIKNFNRNRIMENYLKVINNLTRLEIIIENNAELFPDCFITKNWCFFRNFEIFSFKCRMFSFFFRSFNEFK